jgi:quercetin dioxygenase-like cupin family protein
MTDLIHIHTEARELAPGDLLETDPSRGQLLRVTDGVVYVRREEDETVLVAGDSIALSAGEPRRVWNAGDETARVLVVDRASGARHEAIAKAA